MHEDHKSGRGKGVNEALRGSEPLQPGAPGGVVIHITFVDHQDSRNFVDVIVPWVHCNTEKEGTKRTTHVNTSVYGKGRAKSGLNFMQDSATKENVPAVA